MRTEQFHIALTDDHSLFRSGIASLLKEFPDIIVDFEASNGKDLQKQLPKWHLTTALILMDITMPGMDGFQATKWVKETYPHISVLALSMYEEEDSIVKMIRAGAGGYIFKESKPIELYSAIKEVIHNGYYSNELIAGKLIHSIRANIKQDQLAGLSDKEKEFLLLCVSEDTYKEIAAKMKVATRTVENYREALFEKLDIKSRVGLVLFAIRNGLVKP